MEWPNTVEEPSGVSLSRTQIDSYLKKLEDSGASPATLETYQRHLSQFYRFLPKDKRVQAETLAAWRDSLAETGRAASTVNTGISAVNGLMLHLGHRELQAERLEDEDNVQPELTRSEYLRLLSAARLLGKERAYLLVKIFGSIGITVSELESLTVEAVRVGKISLPSGVVRIPEGLREELLNFANGEGIGSGPVFLSEKGTPQGRTVITAIIKTLSRDAQVAEEKANPRCLRKLYLATQANIRDNLSILAEQTYDRLLEKEQNVIGWK